MAEITKRLPQPCKLEVHSGLRKTLVLHFACARTGDVVTTSTEDWHQWVKVAFGLIKLGKCVVQAATAGNLLKLQKGVEACSSIYNAYRSTDDADFNTFIRQPFLTSQETDRLIKQLRAAHFFEKMEYDAQRAAWVKRDTGLAAEAPQTSPRSTLQQQLELQAESERAVEFSSVKWEPLWLDAHEGETEPVARV